jgi:regulator of protease activity HflC (stomatin/prohibitin superfamily)
MSRDTTAPPTPGIDEAMNRVLREEEQARHAVEACRARAKALLEDAQNRAKRVEQRADARIVRVQWLADRALQRALQHLTEATPQSSTGPPAATEDDRLARAIARMLDELVGDVP